MIYKTLNFNIFSMANILCGFSSLLVLLPWVNCSVRSIAFFCICDRVPTVVVHIFPPVAGI